MHIQANHACLVNNTSAIRLRWKTVDLLQMFTVQESGATGFFDVICAHELQHPHGSTDSLGPYCVAKWLSVGVN